MIACRRQLGRRGAVLAIFVFSIAVAFIATLRVSRSMVMDPSHHGSPSAEAVLPDHYFLQEQRSVNNTTIRQNTPPKPETKTATILGKEYPTATSPKAAGAEKEHTDKKLSILQHNNLAVKLPAGEQHGSKKQREVVEFERQEGVVIATKLHGENTLVILEQSLCLLTQAYNKRMHYDIVVFTTTAINQTLIDELQDFVTPAKLSVVVDNDGFQQEVQKLSPIRRDKFLQRCNDTAIENLTWWSNCRESDGSGLGKLSYNWQAEFRSLHLWKHPALEPYRYMLWMDTDGYCTKVWDRDPIAYMIQNELVLLFDNFPQGRANSIEIQQRIFQAFNSTQCGIKLVDGHFQAKTSGGDNCLRSAIPLVHGFFHITNLDFFRSDTVRKWSETLIGDEFLARRFDDQIAVTVPPAMLVPTRARDMRESGLRLNVYHNGYMDAKERAGPFKKYWKRTGAAGFPEGASSCKIKVNG